MTSTPAVGGRISLLLGSRLAESESCLPSLYGERQVHWSMSVLVVSEIRGVQLCPGQAEVCGRGLHCQAIFDTRAVLPISGRAVFRAWPAFTWGQVVCEIACFSILGPRPREDKKLAYGGECQLITFIESSPRDTHSRADSCQTKHSAGQTSGQPPPRPRLVRTPTETNCSVSTLSRPR